MNELKRETGPRSSEGHLQEKDPAAACLVYREQGGEWREKRESTELRVGCISWKPQTVIRLLLADVESMEVRGGIS